MCLSSPKSTQKSVPLRSKNFVNKGFFGVRGKNAVNPNGFTSILTKIQRKILLSKSDSGLIASATFGNNTTESEGDFYDEERKRFCEGCLNRTCRRRSLNDGRQNGDEG